MSFNYYDALIDNNIIAIDDYKKLKEQIRICNALEIHMSGKNINTDLIRSFIIMSYQFDKSDMEFLQRYDYIRGLIYSSQYASYDGFVEDLEELSKYDMEIIDDVLSTSAVDLKIITGEDKNDNYYVDYFDQILFDVTFRLESFFDQTREITVRQLVNEIVQNKKSINNIGDNAEKIENEESQNNQLGNKKDDSEDIVEITEQDIKDYLKEDIMTVYKKFFLMLNDFPAYVSDVFDSKNIVEEDSDEFKMVQKGMIDYFNYIVTLYKNCFAFYADYYKYSSKNLGLNI